MNYNRPVISVLTVTSPLRAQFYDDLVFSVLSQNYPDIQWLIGYHPDTRDDIRGVLDRHDTGKVDVVLIEQSAMISQASVGVKRNQLLSHARGDYIVNLDDDDFFSDVHALSSLERHFTPETVMVAGRSINVDVDGRFTSSWTQCDPGRYLCGSRALEALTEMDYPLSIHSSAVMMDREVVSVVGGWNGDLVQGEDISLILNMADYQSGHIVVVDDVVHCYRKHDQSMMASEGFADRDTEIIDTLYKIHGVSHNR